MIKKNYMLQLGMMFAIQKNKKNFTLSRMFVERLLDESLEMGLRLSKYSQQEKRRQAKYKLEV